MKISEFKSDELAIIQIDLTPSLAQEFLDNARINRAKSKVRIRRLADEITRGMWDNESPQPIGFDKHGKLADGQHRCEAVVLADKPIVIWAALGMSEKTILKLDANRARSAGDRLYAFSNDKTCKRVVAGSTGRAKYTASICSLVTQAISGNKVRPIDTDLLIIKEFHNDIIWVLDRCGSSKHVRRAPMLSALVMAKYWASREAPELVDQLEETMEGLISGELLSGTTLRLHRYWIQACSKKLASGRKVTRAIDSPWVIFTKSLRAFQAILTGEELQKLQAVGKPRPIFEWFLGDTERLANKIKIMSLG